VRYIAKSSFLGLCSRGMFWEVFTPWEIEVDVNNEKIIIKKRNWYLIGVTEDTYRFRDIKHVRIDEYFFGSDLVIRVLWGTYANIKAISKNDANSIKNLLIKDY